MGKRAVQLRRATSLFAYWRDGRLFLYDFARRLIVSGRPITCEILDFFSEWRTSQEAIAYFADYAPNSVRTALSQLVKQGLLLAKGSPDVVQDDRIAKE